jgi:hypothetical protein
MKLNEANFYTKFIELSEVYNFLVENIFIRSIYHYVRFSL